jgi:hypothetical protein
MSIVHAHAPPLHATLSPQSLERHEVPEGSEQGVPALGTTAGHGAGKAGGGAQNHTVVDCGDDPHVARQPGLLQHATHPQLVPSG